MSSRPSRRAAAAKVSYAEVEGSDDDDMAMAVAVAAAAASSGSEAELDLDAPAGPTTKKLQRLRRPTAAAPADSDDEEQEDEDEEAAAAAAASLSRSGRVRKQVQRLVEAPPSPPKRASSRRGQKGRGKGKAASKQQLEEDEGDEDVEEVEEVTAMAGGKRGKKGKGGGGFDMSAYIKTAAARPASAASSSAAGSSSHPKARAGGTGSRRRGSGRRAQRAAEDDEEEDGSDDAASEEEEYGSRRRGSSRRGGREGEGKGKKKEESEGVRRSSRQGAGGARRYAEEALFAGLDDGSSDGEEEEEEEEEESSEGEAAAGPKRGGGRVRGRQQAVEAFSEEEDEDDDQPIPRLLARRSLTPAEWRAVCQGMNTAEITRGSLWLQEEAEWASDSAEPVEKFLCRWGGMSFLHVSWETAADLVDQVGPHAKSAIKRFLTREAEGRLEYGSGFGGDAEDGDGYFDPQFAEIDRVLAVETDDEGDGKGGKEVAAEPAAAAAEGEEEEGSEDGKEEDAAAAKGNSSSGGGSEKAEGEGEGKAKPRKFLVKWCGLPYHEVTWEKERDLKEKGLERHVEGWRRRQEVSAVYAEEATLEFSKAAYEAQPPYKHGGELRPYQWESVQWMAFNWSGGQGSILADEMGLGKTVQTVAFVHALVEKQRAAGPYLVVAPLSTLQHWYREFSAWTDLNTIVYHGTAEDRAECRASEWWFEDGVLDSFLDAHQGGKKRGGGKPGARGAVLPKFQVLITTPEMILAQDARELAQLSWEVLVVDEAHRLKNSDSRLCRALREEFGYRSALLLTGTPLQNNTEELWTLLNFVSPQTFPDKAAFESAYGDLKAQEQLQGLQAAIRPFLLRRMKEDVEKNLPPKEETVIDVELTAVQKQYYRAIYEKNFEVLTGGRKAADGPSLMNVAMELRKCCNHPFLIRGVEQDIRNHAAATGTTHASDADLLVEYSGKLVLLDKLLPKLRAADHRVLIFSQFKIMLDVLEDYLQSRAFSFGRVDGSVTGDKRQAAIDEFNRPGSSTFVMLLSTKAGGVGITLTAADTVIIFDSDWNPQNDIQAQARCHRIGQTKRVQIYRLITSKTYEQHMFHVASLKLGLDHAVLQSIESSTAAGSSAASSDRMSKEELERLLRHGAYDVFQEEREGEEASKRFCEDDIDAILQQRATRVVHDQAKERSKSGGGAHSNSFSKASFALSTGANGANAAVSLDDQDFWTKVVGMRVAAQQAAQGGGGGGGRSDRRCKQGRKNYREGLQDAGLHSESEGTRMPGADDDDDDDDDDETAALSYAALNRLTAALLKHGYPTWADDNNLNPTTTASAAALASDAATLATTTEASASSSSASDAPSAAAAAAATAAPEQADKAADGDTPILPTTSSSSAAAALVLQRWRALGDDARLKHQHAPHLRTLARHLVAALVRAAAKQRVQERKREAAKKEALAAAEQAAAAAAAPAKAAAAEGVVDLLTPGTPAVVPPVQAVGAGPPIPVVPIPDVTESEMRGECVRVLELIPLARLVLADLEASVAGSLEEPALEEEEEGEEERSGPMDVDDGGGDKKEEAAAEATTAAAEPAMAEGPVVIVVGSHTQEEDDSPALSSSSSNNLPHPRVPTRWDGEEYRRVAAWVSALPLPAFLDEGDMDRAWLRKAFGKLQTLDDLWLLERLAATLLLPVPLASTAPTTQAGKDAKHLHTLSKTSPPAPKYPAPWWDGACARLLVGAMAAQRAVRVNKAVFAQVQAAFPPQLRPRVEKEKEKEPEAAPAAAAATVAAASAASAEGGAAAAAGGDGVEVVVEEEAAPPATTTAAPPPASDPAAAVSVAWPAVAKLGAYFRLLLDGFRRQDLIERGEMAAPAPSTAAGGKTGGVGKRKRAGNSSTASSSSSSSREVMVAGPVLGLWRPPTASANGHSNNAPPAPLFFRPQSSASSTSTTSTTSVSKFLASPVAATTAMAAAPVPATANGGGVIGGSPGKSLKPSVASGSPAKAQTTLSQAFAASSAEKRKRPSAAAEEEEHGAAKKKPAVETIDMTSPPAPAAAAATTTAPAFAAQAPSSSSASTSPNNSRSPGGANNAKENRMQQQQQQQSPEQQQRKAPSAAAASKPANKQSSLMRFLTKKTTTAPAPAPAAAAAAASAAPAPAPMEVVEVEDDASHPPAAAAAAITAAETEEEPN